jgi:hypothetical protein
MSVDVFVDLDTAVVSHRSAEGQNVSTGLRSSMPELYDAQPWRTFRRYIGSTPLPGLVLVRHRGPPHRLWSRASATTYRR